MSLITPILILTIVFSHLFFTVSASDRRQSHQYQYTKATPQLAKRLNVGFRGMYKPFNTTKTWKANNDTSTSTNTWNTTNNMRSPNVEFRGELAREFLVAHNRIRVSKGELPLKWDINLAVYAQRWANNRIHDCKMIHSSGPYGENLFWGGRDHWTPTQVVQSWISESKHYDAKINKCLEGQMCGHYTQIVWRSTARVGCARQTCKNGGLLVICSYDPPGNYANENPFD